MKRSDLEIMAPAGSYESLVAAVEAGADSIYFGVGELNMRSASAANFTLDDLAQIAKYCSERGVRSYLTLNIALYGGEVARMHEVLDRAKMEGVTAVIASDFAVIMYANSIGLPVHISTQCNISNFAAAKLYAQWADVVVLARELSLEQITEITQSIEREDVRGAGGAPLRVEMFAHGAMCMAVSGKCYLSQHESGNSANRGACRQICRRKYNISDEQTGAQLSVDGQYILSPKDLCTIEILDKFIGAGVRVLKIEGRARGGEYVKRVVESYDMALRAMERGEYNAELAAELKTKLLTVFNRGFWEGYYAGKPMPELTSAHGSSATHRKVYVGKVTNFFAKLSVAEVLIEATPLLKGDEGLFMGSTTGVVEQIIDAPMVENAAVERVEQGVRCSIQTSEKVRRGDKLYKMVEANASNSQ